jgi:hypothetical protein
VRGKKKIRDPNLKINNSNESMKLVPETTPGIPPEAEPLLLERKMDVGSVAPGM